MTHFQTTPLIHYPIAEQLNQYKKNMEETTLVNLFAHEQNRFDNFSIEDAGLLLDYSKHWIDSKTKKALIELATQSNIKAAMTALFHGESINQSENRPALHTALRYFGQNTIHINNKNIMENIHQVRETMKKITHLVHSGDWKGFKGKTIKHVVNIGIGGSYLGLKTVTDALSPFNTHGLQIHYIANIDPNELVTVLKQCEPDKTLFIIASKSFNTQETLLNALAARKWIVQNGCTEANIDKHFIAISNNLDAANKFGIADTNILPVWDWVGGRYSLWSAIGLVISLAIGYKNFEGLLKGAEAMDEHFLNMPLEQNMPVIMGVLGIWYQNWFGAQSQAVIAYDYFLRNLPNHLQQLDMESNGKSVQQDGSSVNYQTGAVIWGGTGTNGQHAYHQLLHQGTILIPVDFIVSTTSHNPIEKHHTWLFAHTLSQSRAMMLGQSEQEIKKALIQSGKNEQTCQITAAHKAVPGNRPNSLIITESLTPKTLGALIALYEHKVFVQGHIWGINSFDQWGVELGKALSQTIYSKLDKGEEKLDLDASTNGHIKKFRQRHTLKNI